MGVTKAALVILIGLGCLVGVFVAAIRLPGIWLITAGAFLAIRVFVPTNMPISFSAS